MRRSKWTVVVVATLGALFLSQLKEPDRRNELGRAPELRRLPPSTSQTRGLPSDTVKQMLLALKAGDGELAEMFLTERAPTAMRRADAPLEPPGSKKARFHIEEAVGLGVNGRADVQTTWTEPVSGTSDSTYDVTWLLRLENNKWLITGFTSKVFEDQPEIVMNFEDPSEMLRVRSQVDTRLQAMNRVKTSSDRSDIRRVSYEAE